MIVFLIIVWAGPVLVNFVLASSGGDPRHLDADSNTSVRIRIRIRVSLRFHILSKMIRICNTVLQNLHGFRMSLHCARVGLHGSLLPFTAPGFSLHADTDPAFHFDANPYPALILMRIQVRLPKLIRIRIRVSFFGA